ncbi:MAG: hypothetical protein J2P13_12660, partial [Acidobacteria bacterium]|nr:hypothetical protein [Acidobacteriota bacterium]
SIIPANYPDMIKELQQKDVTITVQDVGNGSWGWLINLLAPLALLALLVALWYAMLRAMLVHLVRVVFREVRRLRAGADQTAGMNFLARYQMRQQHTR